MKTFEVATASADDFLKQVIEAIHGRELGNMTTLQKSGNEITVTISKLGTTELKYLLEPLSTGFKAALKSEKIAFAHRPFRADIEGKLQRVMEKLGAKCT